MQFNNNDAGIKQYLRLNTFVTDKSSIWNSLINIDPDKDLYKNEIETIRDKIDNISNFMDSTWINASETAYKLTDSYIKSSDRETLDVIIRIIIGLMNLRDIIHILLIGDYLEIEKGVNSIRKIKFPLSSNINVKWLGFCEDPYSKREFVSKEYPIYDKYLLSEKWISGINGDSQLNKENIKWLLSNPVMRFSISIGLLYRPNYLQVSKDYIKRLYDLCLSLFSTCNIGGGCILKMPFPRSMALRGIFGLFRIGFNGIHVVTLNRNTKDNDEIYVIGIGFSPGIETKSLINNLQNKYRWESVLTFMAKDISIDDLSLTKLIDQDMDNWIDIVSNYVINL